MVLVRLDDANRLMKNSDVLSLFIGIASCYGGLGAFATIRSIAEINPHVGIVLLAGGILLMVSGLYNTTSVIGRIGDPFLLYFYSRINFLKGNTNGEDFSAYLVLGSVLMLSGTLWTFLYASNFNDALLAAFGMCIILPVATISIRIRSRLMHYRSIYMMGDDADDAYVLSDEYLLEEERSEQLIDELEETQPH